MEIINQEETKFLKMLSQGQKLFDHAAAQLRGTTIPGLPVPFISPFTTYPLLKGHIVWKLHKQGFPVELTQLRAEKRQLCVDMAAYERIRKYYNNELEDIIGVDVHAINDLKNRTVPVTNDVFKYSYTASKSGVYRKLLFYR